MNKLEDVARAIALKLSEHNFAAGPLDHMPLAIAAVEALREPTHDMITAHTERSRSSIMGTGSHFADEAINAWHAMISAVLSEPQTSSKPLPSSDPCQHRWKRGDITWSCDRCGIVKLRKRHPEGQGPEITQDQIEAMERGGK